MDVPEFLAFSKFGLDFTNPVDTICTAADDCAYDLSVFDLTLIICSQFKYSYLAIL